MAIFDWGGGGGGGAEIRPLEMGRKSPGNRKFTPLINAMNEIDW